MALKHIVRVMAMRVKIPNRPPPHGLDELTHQDDDEGPFLAVDKLHADADLQAEYAFDVVLDLD